MRPTRENYTEYVQQRNARTLAAIAEGRPVPGSRVKSENLSMKLFSDKGWYIKIDRQGHDVLCPPKD